MDLFIYLIVGNELWRYNEGGNLSFLSYFMDSIRNFIPVYNK